MIKLPTCEISKPLLGKCLRACVDDQTLRPLNESVVKLTPIPRNSFLTPTVHPSSSLAPVWGQLVQQHRKPRTFPVRQTAVSLRSKGLPSFYPVLQPRLPRQSVLSRPSIVATRLQAAVPGIRSRQLEPACSMHNASSSYLPAREKGVKGGRVGGVHCRSQVSRVCCSAASRFPTISSLPSLLSRRIWICRRLSPVFFPNASHGWRFEILICEFSFDLETK